MQGIGGLIITVQLICLSAAQNEGQCSSLDNYDVTSEEYTLDSQPDFDDQSSAYPRNARWCISVFTNHTDHVIKLEEQYFLLEPSTQCTLDYVTLYDSSGFLNELGRYCRSKGPGTVYSSTHSLFIYFRTDSTLEYRGFRFLLSSIHKDDIPSAFSATSIAALSICVAIVLAVIVIFIFCVIKSAKKNSTRVHVMPQTQRDRPYIIAPNSGGSYRNSRGQRNYVLPKPPSYQESIRNSGPNTQSVQEEVGQRTGPRSSTEETSGSSSTGARSGGRNQVTYGYQSMNGPDDMRYPMSPPPAYQP